MTAARRRGTGRIAGYAAGAALAAFAYGALIERRRYTLREVRIPILPPSATEIRVLHISDLHLVPSQHDKIAWVKALQHLEPDFVIDTGDNVGGPDAIPAVTEAIGPLLRSRPGVYVDGSNDAFAPALKNPLGYLLPNRGPASEPVGRARIDTAALHRVFDGFGWHDLNDASAEISAGGIPVHLIGTSDAHLDYADIPLLRSRIGEVAEAHARGAVVLGVTHAPYRRVLDGFAEIGVDAIFAGHTHGGQVCVPWVGALTTNCDLPRSGVKGLSEWEADGRRVPLHVSAGLGTSVYAPVRFACPPEATLVTLTEWR